MRLYVHWPFCRSRCSYCDFNARVAPVAKMKAYLGALTKEMHAWAFLLGARSRGMRSIYLGGGTPSCLGGSEVADLIQRAAEAFGIEEEAEITVEVNPGTWGEGDFKLAVAGGVDRFSVGVQSLHEGVLRLLSRSHGATEARAAVIAALASGARSVGVDLLFGLPAAGSMAFLCSLEEILALGAQHVSIYALSLAAGSPLARRVDQGDIVLPTEEEVAEEYLSARELLLRSGFEQYEISNFCLPGHECRHNLAYWRREEYLGVGAGAHSFVGGVRFRNESSVMRYMRRVEAGKMPVSEAEAISGEEAREEMIMLGLRTARGISERTIRRAAPTRMHELASGGLLTLSRGRASLTPRGMLVSNAVIVDLMGR